MNPITVHVLNSTPERKVESAWLARCLPIFAGFVLLATILGVL